MEEEAKIRPTSAFFRMDPYLMRAVDARIPQDSFDPDSTAIDNGQVWLATPLLLGAAKLMARVQSQDIGWIPVVSVENNTVLGTTGQSRCLEAIQMVMGSGSGTD